MRPLMPWKSSKYYIFPCVRVCSLSYPASKANAPYYIVICGLSGSTVFFSTLSHKRDNFRVGGRGRGNFIQHKRVFWFSLQLLSKTFAILRRIQRDIINVKTSSCKVPFILVGF
jgi:hypothetical protein